MPDPIPDFDQFVEYVTTDGVFPVALDQHDLKSLFTLATVVRGYIHTARLGRAILAGDAELACVFSEWDAEMGLPENPGVMASMVLAPWPAKSVAVAYVIASSVLLDAINQSRTVALALIRLSLVQDGIDPLAYDEPFTSGQVTALSMWLNEHSITNAEFAALFDVNPALVGNWLQMHPRWQMAQVMHEQFA